MPVDKNLDKKIKDTLMSLPLVSLSADEKASQINGIEVAISSGAVVMREFPLLRLLLDRIKEELAKYMVLSLLVVSILAAGTLGYLAYPRAYNKPPSNEKPALMKPEEKAQTKSKETADTVPEQSRNQETQDQEAPADTAGQTYSNTTTMQRSSSRRTATRPSNTSQTQVINQPTQAPGVPANQAPTCDLKILSEGPLIAGRAVKFSATFSDPDGQIVTVKWNMGDGNTLQHGPEMNLVLYVYAAPGTYTITLTVVDDGGSSAQVSKTITITSKNQDPIADFSDNAPKKAGETITFKNKSIDPDGFIVGVYWDFGDGYTSRDKDATHAYKIPGDYTVTLKVVDDRGATSSFSKIITVLDHPHQFED